MAEVRYKSLLAASFEEAGESDISAIDFDHNYENFFYPLYYLEDFRWVWGNPISYWSTGYLDLSDTLFTMPRQFREGSRFSIHFTLGLCIRLVDGTCIRVENSLGFKTAIGEAADHENNLRRYLSELQPRLSTHDALCWAQDKLKIGATVHKDTADLSKKVHRVWHSRFRPFSNAETVFFREKLKNAKFCTGMAKEDYSRSDAFYLHYRCPGDTTNLRLRIDLPADELSDK